MAKAVDYHVYGTDFTSTAFITLYNHAQVRQTVQPQLQGMADRGAAFIQTAIWFVTEPGTARRTPLYVLAVSRVRFMADNGLRLPTQIDFAWYMSSTGTTYDHLAQRILDESTSLTSMSTMAFPACAHAGLPWTS